MALRLMIGEMVLQPYAIDRMLFTPLQYTVPLDWSNPNDGRTISIHAKLVVAAERKNDSLPVVCWFQGGPGWEAERPEDRSGWLAEMLKRYRVVLLDERGTGLSTPFDSAHGAQAEPKEIAEYLTHFRADSIVKDAEFVRRSLLGDDQSWTIMGQSFGGFCCMTYLSLHAHSVDAAFVLGGFAPVMRGPDEVYQALVEQCVKHNERFFAQFPDAESHVQTIVEYLGNEDVVTDCGDRLTVEQFRSAGLRFGMTNDFPRKLFLMERAAYDIKQSGQLSLLSKQGLLDHGSFRTRPLYALLHESIYCQGEASNWSAARTVANDSRFALVEGKAPLLYGEMVFPWYFDNLAALRPVKEAAELLAQKSDWPALYDPQAMRSVEVPVVGAIYIDDLYVDVTFAQETANLFPNSSIRISNETGHHGLYEQPQKAVEHFFAALDERVMP